MYIEKGEETMDCAKLDEIQKQYQEMGEMIKRLRSQTSCLYPPPQQQRVCQEGWFSGEEVIAEHMDNKEVKIIEDIKKGLKTIWPF